MTQTQLALYYESVKKPGLPVYIIPHIFTLEDGVDVTKLKTAIEVVLAAHPMLGMCFREGEDGMPYLEECAAKSEVKIENVTSEQFEALKQELPVAFDLEGGQLVDVRIFCTPEAKHLYIAVHHAICDGSGVRIIVFDIAAAYRGETLEPCMLTNADLYAQEEAQRQSDTYAEAKQWYADTFTGIDVDSKPLPDILKDEAHDDNASILSTVKTIIQPLSADYDKVFARSRELNVPLSMLLNGAFGYMIGSWNATNESLFCTIHNGRNTEAEKKMVSMLVQTMPVYCNWNNDTTVTDYLHVLADQNRKTKRYASAFAFSEFCALTGFAPLINFSYRGSVQSENTKIEGFIAASMRVGYHTSGEGIYLLLDHVKGKLMLKVEYQGTEYTDAFIHSLIDTYDTVLKGFVECDRLADIQFCSPQMVEKLESFNHSVPASEDK